MRRDCRQRVQKLSAHEEEKSHGPIHEEYENEEGEGYSSSEP